MNKQNETLRLLLSLGITVLLIAFIAGLWQVFGGGLEGAPSASRPLEASTSNRTTPIISMVASPDGQTLATGSYGSRITLWDLSTGAASELDQHQGRVNSLAIASGRLVSGSGDGSVRVWDLSSAFQVADPMVAGARVLSLAADTSGRVAAGYSDGNIRIWNLFDGSLVATIPAHDDQVSSLAFTPADPVQLVSGSHDGTIRVWELGGSAARLRQTMDVGSKVNTVALHPNNGLIASGDYDGRVRLWNLATGNEETGRSLPSHTFIVGDVAFSPNGEWLVSVGYDEKVKIWDLNAGTERQTFNLTPQKAGFLFAAEFVPTEEGMQLATAGYDGLVRLWDLDSGEAEVFAALNAP